MNENKSARSTLTQERDGDAVQQTAISSEDTNSVASFPGFPPQEPPKPGAAISKKKEDEDDTSSAGSSYSNLSSKSRFRLNLNVPASILARRRGTAASIAAEMETEAEETSPDTNDLVALMEIRRKEKEKEALIEEDHEDTNQGNFQPGRIALVCALFVLFLGHCAAAIWCFKNPEPYEHPYTCVTPNCKRMSKWLKEAMNESVNPCENFYMYTCGRHIANFPAFAPKNNVSLTFLEGIPYKYDGNEKLGVFLRPTKKYPVNQILPFYKSCVFQARRDERGLAPFINLLAKLKLLYPNIGGTTRFSIARYAARIFKITSKMCFIHISDTTHNFITVGVASTDHDILVTQPKIYAKSMMTVFKMFKTALLIEDDEEIDTIVWVVMRFEAQLANIQAKGVASSIFGFPDLKKHIKVPKKPHKNYSDKTATWLWQDFIDELYVRGEKKEKPVLLFNYILSLMTQENRFYMLVLEQFLRRNSFYTIFRYFQWTLIKSFSFDLTSELQDAMMPIFRWVGSTATERCFRSVFDNLNALAAERYTLEFPDFKKTDSEMIKIQNLILLNMNNISQTLPDGIASSIVDTFSTLKIIDANIKELSKFITTFYRGLNMSEEYYFANVLAARSIRARNEILRIRKVYPFRDWPIGAYSLSEVKLSFFQEVNVNRRFLHVPFGALYEPFVGNDLPILDVGGYGYYIVGSYMMMYSVSDLLARHASDRLTDEPATDVLYQKRIETELLPRLNCIYDAYSELEATGLPGLKLNPLSPQSRVKNLGDVLNFQLITKIVKLFKDDRNIFPEHQLLPEFEHYSPQQLLHHGIARQSCKANRREVTKLLLENGPTPFELRINGAFRLSSSFAKAWKCPKNAYMNPPTKCEFFKPLKKVKTDWEEKYYKSKGHTNEVYKEGRGTS